MRNRALIGCILHSAVAGRGGRRRGERGGGEEGGEEEGRRVNRTYSCTCVYSRGSPSAISIEVIPKDHWSLC